MNRKSKLFFLILNIFRKMVMAESRENQIYELVNQKKKEIDGKI